MIYEFDTDTTSKTIASDSANKPLGICFENIELKPKNFTWSGYDSVPEFVVRKELGEQIARKIILDYRFSSDKITGQNFAQYSTVVYMKDDLIEMKESNEEKSRTIRKLISDQKEISKLRDELDEKYMETIDELREQNHETLEKWLSCIGKYHEYLGKDNDWYYLLKRSMDLLWMNVKIKTYSLVRFIPLRD